jgi:hypothetical protein
MAFWRELLKWHGSLYFKWSENKLVLIASWVNDSLIIGSKKGIAIVKADLMSRFECDDCGEMQEYVG